jgi:hypothetical protein
MVELPREAQRWDRTGKSSRDEEPSDLAGMGEVES